MFSRRTAWDRSSNRLAEALEKRRLAGAPILDLTETNPTDVGLSYPPEILASLAHPASSGYQPDAAGMRSAREAVTEVFARRGLAVPPEDIVLTASTSEAYAWLFKLLGDPADEVLVPRPSYPLFEFLTQMESLSPVPYDLAFDGSWVLDVESLERRVTERARAVVTVSPNNPTGSYLKQAELATLEELCARHHLALIGDEVFAEYPHGDDATRVKSVLSAEAILTFSLGGLSKLAGLPQLKLGWIALGGPARAKAEARERLELVADTFLSVNTPVQVAAAVILREGEKVREQIRRRIAANLSLLRAGCADIASFRLLSCEGGWTAVLQVPAVMTEEEWVLSLLHEQGVLVHPGYFYDFPRPAFLVLSLLPREESFRQGVSRILARGKGLSPADPA
jgi:aspartate/methionine/tyrosine aminotransferase